MKQTVFLEDLGLRRYQDIWDYQEQLLQQNVRMKSKEFAGAGMVDQNGELPFSTTHHLLLVEHPPVYTLGKTGHEENVLISRADMAQQGIEYFKINRGGDITFHGPGQLVGYPVLDLEKFYKDIGRYMRNLEEVVIRTIAEFGIEGVRSKGETGVWIQQSESGGTERKICALGVRCSRWVTMHGFALNVNNDLGYFSNIIPCGITGKQVTSMQKELGYQPDFSWVKKILLEKFEEVFEVEFIQQQHFD